MACYIPYKAQSTASPLLADRINTLRLNLLELFSVFVLRVLKIRV